MTISVIQNVATGGTSANFGVNVSTGNSIIVIGQGFSGTGAGNFGTPTYNGSTPSGTTELISTSGAAYAAVNFYAAIWLLPDVTGGATSLGLTNAGGVNGFVALEVAGLGASPSIDGNGGISQGYNTSGSDAGMPSGNIPALASSSAILAGTGAIFGGVSYTGPGGWISPSQADYSITQYQIVTGAAGSQYQYDPTYGSSAAWASMIAAVVPAPLPPVSSPSYTAFMASM